ncbi:NACHT domain-containing protein [Saccharothrix sp. NPDC042600]|uniref:NACHT domain-containing protein n=1 Tax=Saccharothrix TaxID=2071 RepID=UPI0033DC55C2|nr:hypothetical protein GCM10017745_70420 [Saccharothrix mutabilis subsp. capreolus]
MRRALVAFGVLVLPATALGVVAHLVTRSAPPGDPSRVLAWGAVVLIVLGIAAIQNLVLRRPEHTYPLDLAAQALARSERGRLPATDDRLRVTLSWSDLRTDEGDTTALARAFRALPDRRLVILGGPGSGKTAAAQRLALDLLRDTPPSNDQVPVVVSPGSWREGRSLREWLVDVPAREHRYPRPRTDLDRLVEAGRVLPILDGLDDVAPGRRAAFLDALDRSGLPYVLTCRTDEYHGLERERVTVAVLEPLSVSDVVGQLPDRGERWTPLVRAIAAEPEGPLAVALSTPRALGLVLRAYAAPDTTPAELLDTTRFATPDAIERHLLESALVRAASGTDTDGYRPGDRAAEWLGFLAAHLGRLDTADLAWWRLGRDVPRAVFVGVAVLVGALVGVFGGLLFGLWVGVVTGVGAEIAAAFGLGWSLSSAPSAARHPQESLSRDRRMALVQGVVVGVTVVLAVGLASAFERGVALVVGLGVAAGLVGVCFSAYGRYSVSRVWLALLGRVPWRLMTFLEAERRLGLLRHSGGVYQFHHRRLRDHLAAEYGSGRPPVDPDAVRMIRLLRADLVERACARADVRAVVEAPAIERLTKEVAAEIADSEEDLVLATAAARERYVAVKERLLASAGVPRLALAARSFGHAGGPLAALAGGAALATTAAPPVVLAVGWTAGVVAAVVMVLQPGFWEPGLPAGEEDERSRVVERLLNWHRAVAVRLAPLHRAHFSVFWGVIASCGVLIATAVAPPGYVDFMRSVHPVSVYVVGGAAVVFGVLWLWSRPLKKRWDALSVDDPGRWPAETALPRRAAQARRDAVRAWEALVESLVENGVLPMVAARVEVLAERSFDTRLPDASVKRLGDLTESAQFVPTDTSARLNRMLDAMAGGAIGLSGPRGIGKSTVLGIFGDRRFGGNPDDLTVVVPAPTDYDSRDFLVHLFSRMCLAVLPADTRAAAVTARRGRVRWVVTAVVGVLLVAGAALWPAAVEAGRWAWRNVRVVAAGAGALLLVALAVEAVARRRSRRDDTSVADVARGHLRALRYLETTTRTATAGVKSGVELGGSHARQRAEQVKTYPELVGEFRDFLAFLVAHLPTRPDRRAPRIVVCIDEVDKIATAEAAEQFINDVKTVFGVPGCFFLVAVSEDALAAFSRRALTVRTAFDSAFDNVIQVSRLSLAQTRRLLVQRVLRLPEPYVWLCHALSGGLPRDLNRTVRQLYDIRLATGVAELGALAADLVRQDLETVTYGQVLRVNSGSDAVSGALLGWLAKTPRVPVDHDALIGHRDDAPSAGVALKAWPPELWAVRERFQAYLSYAAIVLRSFQEREILDRLSATGDAWNPVRHLADARNHLAVDAALATAALDAYRSEIV